MKKNPLVSIIILHYNRFNDLLETLNNTYLIDYPNFEIILVDNGSKDIFIKKIKEIKNNLIKKIFIKKNQGSAYGHTVGMKEAKGEYLVTIDDDSFVSINSIKVLVKLFEKNENLGAVGLGMVNPNTNFNQKDFEEEIDIEISKDSLDNSFESIIATSAAFFRKKCLREVNYYDLNWNWYTEDTELILKIISKGYNTINIPQIIAYHKSSLVNRNFDLMLKNSIEGTILLYFKFFPLREAFQNYFRIISFAIFNSIFNFNLKYLIFSLVPPKKLISIIKNRVYIDQNIRKKIHIPGNAIFSRK